jgi:HNH endonuclease
MLCIFCSKECPPSLEHVFPLAIGGTVTTDRVCEPCNSLLGSRVDSALSDFLPIRTRRAELRLAGNAGAVPELFEIFTGEATVIGQAASRIRTTIDKATGKLDHRQLYHASEVVRPDGQKVRQITIDARDKGQIPTIIQRERKRHGMRPLSSEELAVAASNYVEREVRNPLIKLTLNTSFAYLRHAMFKIVYELAFLWLGDPYLADPLAMDLRTAIRSADVASTDNLIGYVGEAEECTSLNDLWTPHKAHHLAFASIVANQVVICARVFDIYAAGIVVSRDPDRYFRSPADAAKLRFLAIDSVSGKTLDSPFAHESRRIAGLMSVGGERPHSPTRFRLADA